MSRSIREYLQHMLDETHYLLDHMQDLNKDVFLRDETFKRAFVRSLEIIGKLQNKVISLLDVDAIMWIVDGDVRGRYGHEQSRDTEQLLLEPVVERLQQGKRRQHPQVRPDAGWDATLPV